LIQNFKNKVARADWLRILKTKSAEQIDSEF
jgi:hypothetical protein